MRNSGRFDEGLLYGSAHVDALPGHGLLHFFRSERLKAWGQVERSKEGRRIWWTETEPEVLTKDRTPEKLRSA